MHTTRTSHGARLCRVLGAGLTGLVLMVGGVALLAPVAGAQADDQPPSTEAPSGRDMPRRRFPHRAWLTEAQRECLREQGVERPAPGERPTEEQREAFRAAAEECGIELPRRGCPPGAVGPDERGEPGEGEGVPEERRRDDAEESSPDDDRSDDGSDAEGTSV